LSLIGSVLIDRNDEVVVENPTYPYAVNLFKSLRAKICSTTIDAEGICINEVVCNKPKLVYTTPSNQHPTGVKMSKNRRIELLKWATKNSAFIVEDDYDHEFSNWENPITPIYNLDEHSRVIYLGSFNKILHPSIRLGYMIIPEYLLDSISGLLQQSSRFVSPSIQKTLSLFIEKDYLNRHLRNVIQVSSERKEVFLKALSENFENELTINSNNKGLNVIAELKEGVDDEKLSNYLNETGITTYAYSNYFHQGDKKNGLVMGYCSVNNALIQENITKMAASYYEFIELQKR
jgi:GntR family transcriptional regulator/MocR family aminotransferase